MSKVSILIPHYNNPSLIEPCLASLRALSNHSPSHSITVIDDGSTDGSVESIKKEFPEVHLVERKENGGFIQAIHSGIRESDGEILVFLNNDTWVERDWLRQLVEPLENGKIHGATGSILMDWEGKRALFKGVSINLLGYGFEDQGELPNPEGAPLPVLCGCGGAMAIPRGLYEESGGFDESYGMIYEDLDLGWRLNLMGYDCVLMPASRVGHRAHASLGRSSFERKAKHYLLNPLRTLFKNWDGETHLEILQLAVTLAQARERACLYGGAADEGMRGWMSSLFPFSQSTSPLVDSMILEEERSRAMLRKRESIQACRKVSTREIFERFVPHPERIWFFDEEQRQLLERAGYWDLEGRLYRRHRQALPK